MATRPQKPEEGRQVSWLELLNDTWLAWRADGAGRLSAALAFYTLLSLAPLTIIGVAVAGLIFSQGRVRQEIIAQATSLLGQPAHDVTETLLDNALQAYWFGSSTAAVVAGVIFLLFAASAVIHELSEALDIVWGVYHHRRGGFLRGLLRRLASFAMILGLGFLALMSLLMSTGLALFSDYVSARLAMPVWLLGALDVLVNLVFIGLLFALIYKYLPDTKVGWRFVWPGALLATMMFTASKWLIGVYIGRSALASAYGAAGSVVVFMLWIFIAAQIFLFGAELSKVLSSRAERLEPGV